jgi:hypothetical protein
VNLTSCAFRQNKAIIGSHFILNSAVVMTRCEFYSNSAVQGTGVFASGSVLEVNASTFTSNYALAIGGVFSLLNTSLVSARCSFASNHADEGAVFYVNESRVVVEEFEVSENVAYTGTFLVGNRSKIFIAEGRFEDPFWKAFVIDRLENIGARDVFFSCHTQCEEYVNVLPLPPGRPRTRGWVPAAGVGIVIVLPLCWLQRKKVLRTARRRLRRKDKYIL